MINAQKIFLLSSLLLLCLQCRQGSIQPDTKLLSIKEMGTVLIEIHALEALILERNYNLLDSAQAAYQAGEKGIFKKAKISYTQYKSSYAYYLRENPQILDDIYLVVIDSLSKREQKATLSPEKNIPKDTVKVKPQTHPKSTPFNKATPRKKREEPIRQ